jgi:hypothetical protein
MADKKSWKEALLRSSLPLEHVVAEALINAGVDASGPFSYLRPNEHNVPTEFSVDIAAASFIKTPQNDFGADLQLLIECKYTTRDASWVFTPLSDSARSWIGEPFSVWQSACTQQLDAAPVVALARDFPLCGRGVSLQAKDSNVAAESKSTLIDRGIAQLRYAAPHFLAHALRVQHVTFEGHGLPTFVGHILVTTAPLFVLRPGLALESFLRADDLEEVAERVPHLVAFQEPGPHLIQYASRAASHFLSSERGWAERLDAVGRYALIHPDERIVTGTRPSIDRDFANVTRHIVIVSFEQLTALIDRLAQACREAAKSARLFGSFVVTPTPGYGDEVKVE